MVCSQQYVTDGMEQIFLNGKAVILLFFTWQWPFPPSLCLFWLFEYKLLGLAGVSYHVWFLL